jgi:hypothetical protein
MANAIKVDPLRVRKYFPPGWRVEDHESFSWELLVNYVLYRNGKYIL